ncbi:MAG: glycine zipper 2TM domain-containing protein [Pseudomonadota bacterium]
MNRSMLGGLLLGIAVATTGAVVAGFALDGAPPAQEDAPEVAAAPSNSLVAPAAPVSEVAPAEPIVVAEAAPAPKVVCRDVEVVDDGNVKDDKKIAGTAIGAVVGGVVGNAMGKDDGKIGTVVGAAAGAVAGRVAQDQYQDGKKVTRYETVCEEVPAGE